jgi:hypothetical protein
MKQKAAQANNNQQKQLEYTLTLQLIKIQRNETREWWVGIKCGPSHQTTNNNQKPTTTVDNQQQQELQFWFECVCMYVCVCVCVCVRKERKKQGGKQQGKLVIVVLLLWFYVIFCEFCACAWVKSLRSPHRNFAAVLVG